MLYYQGHRLNEEPPACRFETINLRNQSLGNGSVSMRNRLLAGLKPLRWIEEPVLRSLSQ